MSIVWPELDLDQASLLLVVVRGKGRRKIEVNFHNVGASG